MTPLVPKRGRFFEAPRRGPLFRLMWPFTSWLVTNLCATVFWVWLFVFNRATVKGRHNVGRGRNVLLISNHQTMIDSFVIGIAAFFPWAWIRPHLLPWNPAAVENLYHRKFLSWMSDNWKCIPVKEGRKDMGALRRMIEVLPRGTMILFPEGRRSRDGRVGEGRPGPGLLALSTRCKVVPVAIHGIHSVYPIGRFRPGFFKDIHISFGEPIDYSDLAHLPRSKETAQLLVERAMVSIRRMHAEMSGFTYDETESGEASDSSRTADQSRSPVP